MTDPGRPGSRPPEASILSMLSPSDAVFHVAGSVLFRQGEGGKLAYVVVEGELEILYHGQHLATVTAGGIAGELALIDSAPRSADCVAKTNVKVVVLDERRFTFLVQKTPDFALQVMRVMAERIRATNALAVKGRVQAP
jgi:CRP/FNR family transcriptional regulator, cyclic AMP receptor protein